MRQGVSLSRALRWTLSGTGLPDSRGVPSTGTSPPTVSPTPRQPALLPNTPSASAVAPLPPGSRHPETGPNSAPSPRAVSGLSRAHPWLSCITESSLRGCPFSVRRLPGGPLYLLHGAGWTTRESELPGSRGRPYASCHWGGDKWVLTAH